MSRVQSEGVKRPRKPRKSGVEKRLEGGATLLKVVVQGQTMWAYADTGRTARADVVRRLIRDGKVKPSGDGLFGDDSQSWGLA